MTNCRTFAALTIFVAAFLLGMPGGWGQGISEVLEPKTIVIIIERSEHIQQDESYMVDYFEKNLSGILPMDSVGVVYYGSTATALGHGASAKATIENKQDLRKQVRALKPEVGYDPKKSALLEAVKLAVAMKPTGILLLGPSRVGPEAKKALGDAPAWWVNVVAMPDASKELRGELEGWSLGRCRQVEKADVEAYVRDKHAASQPASASTSQPATKPKE